MGAMGTRVGTLGLLVTFLLTIGGCGSSGANRAGGAVETPTTLKASNALAGDDVSDFAKQIDILSKGQMRVELSNGVGGRTPESEGAVIEQVRSGKADIGMVGSRAWTSAGVTSYDALIAPMLIDSYALEADVLQSPLVDRMASGLASLGLVGIGVLPGPLREVLGKSKAFTEPSDFAGAMIGISKSDVAAETFVTLGGHAIPMTAAADISGYDAIELQVPGMSGNKDYTVGRFLTTNIRLWPRPIVVFMSKSGFDRLSTAQQSILRDAVGAAIPAVIAKLESDEREGAGILCREGVGFVNASETQLASLRTAVQPVIDRMRREDPTGALIDAIAALKAAHPANDPAECAIPTPTAAPTQEITALDGTWQACPTEQDILAAGGTPDEARVNAGCSTWQFERGVFSAGGPIAQAATAGSYIVEKDLLTTDLPNGEVFTFTWGVVKGHLILGKSDLPGAVSPAPAIALPWRRIGD